MEKLKEMELEILIAIRNNETVESNQFHKLFGNKWPFYKECISLLFERDLFEYKDLQEMQGLKKYELTRQGNNRITQLLNERSHAIHVKLAHLRREKNLESSRREQHLFSLFNFITFFSSRFKRQVH
jgi:hypothetical protein